MSSFLANKGQRKVPCCIDRFTVMAKAIGLEHGNGSFLFSGSAF